MRQKHFTLIILVITIIYSCTKKVENPNYDIIGKWIWETSVSSSNVHMLTNDTTRIYSLQFNNDYSFTNEASCIVGGPTDGHYHLKEIGSNKILILLSPNYQPDTLKLSLTANSLALTETSNGCSWSHYFHKQ